MKSKFLPLFLLAFNVSLFSQSICRSIISPYGNSSFNASGNLTATLGETMVTTYFSSNSILTQGFEQPDTLLTTSISDISSSLSFKSYPNPTHDFVYIEGNNSDAKNIIRISDVSGRQLVMIENASLNKNNITKIDFRTYEKGVYFLTLLDISGEIKSVFKVVKE
ncbi:MAG: T9SS type A sorting domain-containing protein [Bacteroidota bacterium]